MNTIPKAKLNESRKSNHAHTSTRHTHTLPLSLMSGVSVQTKSSDHRSKQLHPRPPDTVTQLVRTFEMQLRHVVLIWWRRGSKQAAATDCENSCESECRILLLQKHIRDPAVQRTG